MLLKLVMLAVLALVPPLATGNTPVTPVVSGNPVQFVSVPDVGVPSSGVTSVGLVESTTEPLPVLVVTPVPPLKTGSAEDSVSDAKDAVDPDWYLSVLRLVKFESTSAKVSAEPLPARVTIVDISPPE